MSYRPITQCEICGDYFDVYAAPGERICESCVECQPLVAAHDPRPLPTYHQRRVTHIVHGILALASLAALSLALGCWAMGRCDYLWGWWTR